MFQLRATYIRDGKEEPLSIETSKPPLELSIDDLNAILLRTTEQLAPGREREFVFFESGGSIGAVTLTATIDGLSITLGPAPMTEDAVNGLIRRGTLFPNQPGQPHRH